MSLDLAHLKVTNATPSVKEYLKLRREGGLSPFSEEAAQIGLKGTLFAVTLRLEDEAVGMGRIIGDGGCFFQIVDIAVDPRLRGKGLGKQIMENLIDYADMYLPDTAFLSLLADVPADKLYSKFGFAETAPISLGMSRRVTRG